MKEVIANRRARKQLGKVASEKENNREDLNGQRSSNRRIFRRGNLLCL